MSLLGWKTTVLLPILGCLLYWMGILNTNIVQQVHVFKAIFEDPAAIEQVMLYIQNPKPYELANPLLQSRMNDVSVIIERITSVSNDDIYPYFTGLRFTGKTLLVKHVVNKLNSDPQYSNVHALYFPLHSTLDAFIEDIFSDLHLDRNGTTFPKTIKLLENAAGMFLRKWPDHQIVIFIDGCSADMDSQIQSFARRLSAKKGQTVVLIGSDGIMKLRLQYDHRCQPYTLCPFNANQMTEYVQWRIPDIDAALTMEIVNVIMHRFTPEIHDVNELLSHSIGIDNNGSVTLMKAQMNNFISLKIKKRADRIEGLIAGNTTTEGRKKKIFALKDLLGQVHDERFDEISFQRKINERIRDEESLGYQLIKENMLLSIPETDQLQFIVPMTRHAILSLAKSLHVGV